MTGSREDSRSGYDVYLDEVNRYFEANPYSRLRRDAVVQYAEERGGIVLDVLQRLYPMYWLIPKSFTREACARELGITTRRIDEIVRDLGRAILPTLTRSKEFEDAKRAYESAQGPGSDS